MSDYQPTTADELPLFATAAPEPDRKRLSDQCRTILRMLQAGDCTNDELSRVARKYTSRISDLRKAGYVIPRPVDLGGGVTRYTLKGRSHD